MDSKKLSEINQLQADKALSNTRHQESIAHTDNVSQTVLSATSSLIEYLEGHTSKTKVVNQLQSISTPDVKYVVEALQVLDATLKTHENTDLSGVTQLMQELVAQAKLIPKDNPEIPKPDKPIDYTKQLKGLADAIKAVEKVVKSQKLIAEAPIVNVPETNVNVAAPDLKPLQSGFKDVVSAVNDIVIPEYKTDNKAVEKLLKDQTKILDKILKKPVSSGGGGGSSWPALGTNGLPAPLNLDSSGNLKITGGSGGSGTQYTDGDATITHPIGTIPVFNKAGTITAVSDTNPLPTSATVSLTNYANETGGNLAAIKADVDKIPSQGQALAAASTPVVLPAAQITTLTPPAAITNYAKETGGNLDTIAGKDFATQTTLALIKAKTDNIDVALSTRTKPADAQHVIVDSGVTTGLTDTQLRATPVPVSGTVTATPTGTQDDNIKQVNGTVVNVGTGTAGAGTQRVAVSSDSFPSSQAVTGTFFQTTQPVSAATLPLPTGAATSANQTTGNSSLSSIDGKLSGTLTTSLATVPQADLPSAPLVNQKTVTTAGTAVQLQTNTLKVGIIVQALSTNAGSVFVGPSTVSASTGFELQAGQATSFGVSNSNAIWVDAATNGDKVCWAAS